MSVPMHAMDARAIALIFEPAQLLDIGGLCRNQAALARDTLRLVEHPALLDTADRDLAGATAFSPAILEQRDGSDRDQVDAQPDFHQARCAESDRGMLTSGNRGCPRHHAQKRQGHTPQIFGKLQATNKTRALAHARQHELPQTESRYSTYWGAA
jgi:hypothetical protein